MESGEGTLNKDYCGEIIHQEEEGEINKLHEKIIRITLFYKVLKNMYIYVCGAMPYVKVVPPTKPI